MPVRVAEASDSVSRTFIGGRGDLQCRGRRRCSAAARWALLPAPQKATLEHRTAPQQPRRLAQRVTSAQADCSPSGRPPLGPHPLQLSVVGAAPRRGAARRTDGGLQGLDLQRGGGVGRRGEARVPPVHIAFSMASAPSVGGGCNIGGQVSGPSAAPTARARTAPHLDRQRIALSDQLLRVHADLLAQRAAASRGDRSERRFGPGGGADQRRAARTHCAKAAPASGRCALPPANATA